MCAEGKFFLTDLEGLILAGLTPTIMPRYPLRGPVVQSTITLIQDLVENLFPSLSIKTKSLTQKTITVNTFLLKQLLQVFFSQNVSFVGLETRITPNPGLIETTTNKHSEKQNAHKQAEPVRQTDRTTQTGRPPLEKDNEILDQFQEQARKPKVIILLQWCTLKPLTQKALFNALFHKGVGSEKAENHCSSTLFAHCRLGVIVKASQIPLHLGSIFDNHCFEDLYIYNSNYLKLAN